MNLSKVWLRLTPKGIFLSVAIILAPAISIAASTPPYTPSQITANFQQNLRRFMTGTNTSTWSTHGQSFFQTYEAEVSQYLAGERERIFKDEFNNAVNSTDGPGPDILELRKQVRTLTANVQGGATGSSPSNTPEYAVREAGRLSTLIRIDSLLGNDGDNAYQAVNTGVREDLDAVVRILDEGYNDNITQDVMKKVLAVQGIQSKIMADSRLEQMRARVDSQYTNLNLVDIARTLEESNRSQKVENRANTDYLLRSSAAAIR
jgi:hypothetical protein